MVESPRCMAAWTLAVAMPATPPSSAAMRSSSTALVGLEMRLYTWPACSILNSEAAWSELLKANEDVKWMGVARAPLAGSGAAPACSDKVSKPGYFGPLMVSPPIIIVADRTRICGGVTGLAWRAHGRVFSNAEKCLRRDAVAVIR